VQTLRTTKDGPANCKSSLDGHLPGKCPNVAVKDGFCQRCSDLAKLRREDWEQHNLPAQETAPPDPKNE
jgi:hypothetical protein